MQCLPLCRHHSGLLGSTFGSLGRWVILNHQCSHFSIMGMLTSCSIDGQHEVGIVVLGAHDRLSPWTASWPGFWLIWLS